MLQTCHTAVEESPLFIFTHHFLSFCQLCRQGPHRAHVPRYVHAVCKKVLKKIRNVIHFPATPMPYAPCVVSRTKLMVWRRKVCLLRMIVEGFCKGFFGFCFWHHVFVFVFVFVLFFVLLEFFCVTVSHIQYLPLPPVPMYSTVLYRYMLYST
jgi:hypothetical protein